MNREKMIQAAVLILGSVGATLIVFGGELTRWGYLFSLLGQPFWISVFWREKKWGMLIMSMYFTVVWGAGVAFSWGWV